MNYVCQIPWARDNKHFIQALLRVQSHNNPVKLLLLFPAQ